MNPKRMWGDETLLQCPFCGGDPSWWSDNERWWIECDSCQSRGPQERMHHKNKRVVESEKMNYQEELERKIEDLEKELSIREEYEDKWKRVKPIIDELRQVFKTTHYVNMEYLFDIIESVIIGGLEVKESKSDHEKRERILNDLSGRS